jgi:uncharacterized protein (DUF58 family)
VRRLLVLAVLIYVIVFWALIGLNGRLLALAILPVLAAGAGLLFAPLNPRVRVRRTLSADRVSSERPVSITLHLTNAGPPIEEMLIEETLPPGLRVIDGRARLLTSLASGQSVELTCTVQGGRGTYLFEPPRVTARDRLGLIERQAVVEMEGDSALHILPDVIRLRHIPLRPRQTRVFAGTIPARIGGPGVEFMGVRAYQPADALRHLNWRASARHPMMLYTNEFQQERIADVGLILDARQRADVKGPGGRLFEHSVTATAALAEAFLHDGNRVGLLCYGRFLDWTPPGYGRQQRQRILDALARTETGTSQVFEGLKYLPTRFFPAKSQVVLISPLCSDDLPFLVRLRGQGYELLVISPNPVMFETAALGSSPEVALAARIAAVERAVLLNRLRQAGVRIVDWDTSRPLGSAIAASLARQPVWRRGR